MANNGEFQIKITGDASSLMAAAQQTNAALNSTKLKLAELTPEQKENAAAMSATGKAAEETGRKVEEGGESADRSGISHRALHLIFRQVGEASKGLEVGMMALSGVMMGSATFGIYAVSTAIQALIAHFAKQKEIALEAAKATVQFWTDALQGNADARKAAEDYATALANIMKNVDALKQKEAEEEAVLRAVATQRQRILDAERQAELAAAKGDKAEEARINARYGQRKSDVELESEQAKINLDKQHLAEQMAAAQRAARAADAAERAKERGAPGREEANAGEEALPKLKEEIARLQAEHDAMASEVSIAGGELVPNDAKAAAAEALSAAKQEYEQRQSDIEAFKSNTAALTKAAADALAQFNKAVETVDATRRAIGTEEMAHKVNVDAANTIKGIKSGEIIAAAGAPDNRLSRAIVSDIQSMEGLAQGGRMDANQTAMMNHLIAGLRAQGASQETINGLLLEMKDLHVDAQKKFQDIWAQLKQLQGSVPRTF